jgi:hypothetical protein
MTQARKHTKTVPSAKRSVIPVQRRSKPKSDPAFLHPASLPDKFALRVVGDCLAPLINESEPTVAQLCREWRLVNAKLAYDVACLPEGQDSEELCTAANQRIFEIEEELAASRIDDLDDAQAVLSIIGKNMDEELMGEDRDRAMLRAVHRGMNHIRNKLAPTT